MKSLSHVRLFATPWTAAYQAPPPMGLVHAKSLQSCLTLCDPMDYNPPASSVPGDSPSKNTRVGCHSLLQGIFPTQGSNPSLPHYRQILYCLSHQGSHSLIQRLLANLCPLSSGENYYINYPERLASLPWGREGVVLIIPRVSLGRGYS